MTMEESLDDSESSSAKIKGSRNAGACPFSLKQKTKQDMRQKHSGAEQKSFGRRPMSLNELLVPLT